MMGPASMGILAKLTGIQPYLMSIVSAVLGVSAVTLLDLSTAEMFAAILAVELAQLPLLFNLHGRVSTVEAVQDEREGGQGHA